MSPTKFSISLNFKKKKRKKMNKKKKGIQINPLTCSL